MTMITPVLAINNITDTKQANIRTMHTYLLARLGVPGTGMLDGGAHFYQTYRHDVPIIIFSLRLWSRSPMI